MPSRLLLLGGGPSHLFVLEALARRPLAGVDVVLVCPDPLATYSGMIPGVLAGRYPVRAAQIDLRRLSRRAGAHFEPARAVAVDPAARIVTLHDGRPLAYDVASLDIGSRTSPLPVADGAVVVPIKPIEPALAAIAARLAAEPTTTAVVVGAGAAGCEVAFAMRARGAAVALCDRAPRPLPGFAPAATDAAARALAAAGIDWRGASEVVAIECGGVRFADGTTLPATLVVVAAGAVGDALLAASGLDTDARGFLLVDDALRALRAPSLFAAGDCATLASRPGLPKAGVYAVRQGPILAANLRAALRGDPQRPYRPQRRTLALLNTADDRAILSYGDCAAHAGWAWRLKDAIDRRFVRRFDR